MSKIENTIKYLEKLKHFTEISNIDEFFRHMQGHTKELSLICSVFDVDYQENIEIVTSALTKQIPKKPYNQGYEYEGKMIYPVGINGVPYDLCPSCHTLVSGNKLDNYCCKCGQKLDWSKYKNDKR